jgi:hypothetical protein
MIFTAEDLLAPPNPGMGEDPAWTYPVLLVRRAWPHQKAPFQMPEGLATVSAHAEVNHGRWIVFCPFCAGAQMASAADHRFFCVDCLHELPKKCRGKWLPVIWPKNREDIEVVLLERPGIENRNWFAVSRRLTFGFVEGETIAELRKQNRARGIKPGLTVVKR